jgi:hypothetical protein
MVALAGEPGEVRGFLDMCGRITGGTRTGGKVGGHEMQHPVGLRRRGVLGRRAGRLLGHSQSLGQHNRGAVAGTDPVQARHASHRHESGEVGPLGGARGVPAAAGRGHRELAIAEVAR